MTIATSNRYHKYEPVVATTNFDVPFPLYDNDDLRIDVDGATTTAYSVTATYSDGVSNDAVVVLTTAVDSVDVEIYGARLPRRDNNYLDTAPEPVKRLQNDMDFMTAAQQEQRRDLDRSLKISPAVDGATALTETATERVSKVVAFTADGLGLTAGPTVTEVSNAEGYAQSASTAATATAADRVQTSADVLLAQAAANSAVSVALNREATNAGFTAAADSAPVVAWDEYLVSLSNLTAYSDGVVFNIKAEATATGPIKANVNNFGLLDVETSDGVQFRDGTITAGAVYLVRITTEQSSFKLRFMTAWEYLIAEHLQANGSFILYDDGLPALRIRGAGASGDIAFESWDATLNGGLGDWGDDIMRFDGSLQALRFTKTPSVGTSQSSANEIYHGGNVPLYTATTGSAVFDHFGKSTGALAGTVDGIERVETTTDGAILYVLPAHLDRAIHVNADNVTIFAADMAQGQETRITVKTGKTGCKLWIGDDGDWDAGSVVTDELIDLPAAYNGKVSRIDGDDFFLESRNGMPTNSMGAVPVGASHVVVAGQSKGVRFAEIGGIVGHQEYFGQASKIFWTSTADGGSSLIPRDATDTDNWLNTDLTAGPHFTAMVTKANLAVTTHSQADPSVIVVRQGDANVSAIGDYHSYTLYRDAWIAFYDLAVAEWPGVKVIIQPFAGLQNTISPFQMSAIRFAQSEAAAARTGIILGVPTYAEERLFGDAHPTMGGAVESGKGVARVMDYHINGNTAVDLGPKVYGNLCYRLDDNTIRVVFDRSEMFKHGNSPFHKSILEGFGFFVMPTAGADDDANMNLLAQMDEDDLFFASSGSWSNYAYDFKFAAGVLPDGDVTMACVFGQMENERAKKTYAMSNDFLPVQQTLPFITKPNLMPGYDLSGFSEDGTWTLDSDNFLVNASGDGAYSVATVTGLASGAIDYEVCLVVKGQTSGNLNIRLNGTSLVSGPSAITDTTGGEFEYVVPITAEAVSGSMDIRIDPNSNFDGTIKALILRAA